MKIIIPYEYPNAIHDYTTPIHASAIKNLIEHLGHQFEPEDEFTLYIINKVLKNYNAGLYCEPNLNGVGYKHFFICNSDEDYIEFILKWA